MKYMTILFVLAGFVSSCTPKAEQIAFGEDMCAHCKMTIVDVPFAAEAVTNKAKVFKFDAIECMLDFLKTKQPSEMALLLVRDFANPKEWQDAQKCSYLVSKDLPSPMGAGLSAWSDKEPLLEMQAQKGGEIFEWPALVKRFE